MVKHRILRCVPLAVVWSLVGLVAPLEAQEATFTDLRDLVPTRCFSVPLTAVGADAVDIGFESGFNSTSWTSNAFIASTKSFHSRTATDTFTFTVTAPPGKRLTRIHYNQAGTRFLERSTYWAANGTGALTVNGAALPFSFTFPTLSKTVDLTGQNIESTTVSIQVSLNAYRNSAFPRVKDAPGSATISLTDAVISVEYE
jgi:hypothetical protein